MLKRAASLRRKSGGVLVLLATLAVTVVGAFGWHGAGVPPVLWFLPVWGSVGALLGGFRMGHIAFGLGFGLLAIYYATRPFEGAAEYALRWNLATVTCIIQLFLVGYHRIFGWLQSRLEQQEIAIERRLGDRTALTEALEHAVERTVSSMQTLLEAEAPLLYRLKDDHRALERILARAREALHRDRLPAGSDLDVVPDFAQRMARWLIWISFGHTVIIALRVGLATRGALTPTLIVMGCTLLGALVLRLRPKEYAPVTLGVALVTTLSVTAAFSYWGFAAPQPNLVLLPSLAYPAVLIGGAWVETASAIILLGVVGFVGVRGVDFFDLFQWSIVGAVAISIVTMQAVWHEIERRMRAKLSILAHHTRALTELERFRMRVSGTLFHDVANLVQALGFILIRCEKDGRVGVRDLRLLRDLQHRLVGLVKAVLDVLSSSELRDGDRLVATPLPATFQALEELFAHRLNSKTQTLHVHSRELTVLAAPELLRDSVLANLISNAIKFSPPGATIELSAREAGKEVEIVVRDQGPGFPDSLEEKLKRRERVVSTRGSADEQGLGLGLSLACEHLQRMGGRLMLGRHERGGGEARVRLQAA